MGSGFKLFSKTIKYTQFGIKNIQKYDFSGREGTSKAISEILSVSFEQTRTFKFKLIF